MTTNKQTILLDFPALIAQIYVNSKQGICRPKIVITHDSIFHSINAAASYYGVHRNTMRRWCNDPTKKDFEIVDLNDLPDYTDTTTGK